MGVVLDAEGGAAWAITSRHSRKVRNIEAAGEEGALAAVCQVDGRRWSTLEGRVRVRSGEDDVGGGAPLRRSATGCRARTPTGWHST